MMAEVATERKKRCSKKLEKDELMKPHPIRALPAPFSTFQYLQDGDLRFNLLPSVPWS